MILPLEQAIAKYRAANLALEARAAQCTAFESACNMSDAASLDRDEQRAAWAREVRARSEKQRSRLAEEREWSHRVSSSNGAAFVADRTQYALEREVDSRVIKELRGRCDAQRHEIEGEARREAAKRRELALMRLRAAADMDELLACHVHAEKESGKHPELGEGELSRLELGELAACSTEVDRERNCDVTAEAALFWGKTRGLRREIPLLLSACCRADPPLSALHKQRIPHHLTSRSFLHGEFTVT